MTPRTRAILVNTPHNPTGKVFSREELEFLAALCREKDLLCITDEVYEHLVYDGAHVPMAIAARDARAHDHDLFVRQDVLADRLEDRLGRGAAGADGGRPRGASVRHVRHGDAAAARRRGGPRRAARLLRAALPLDYLERRDLLVRELSAIGFGVRPPAGTYFVCADFTGLRLRGRRRLLPAPLEKIGVAAIPPSFFYDHKEQARGYVRFAFCKREETLARPCRGMRQAREEVAAMDFFGISLATIVVAVFFGFVGFAAFRYGKKIRRAAAALPRDRAHGLRLLRLERLGLVRDRRRPDAPALLPALSER